METNFSLQDLFGQNQQVYALANAKNTNKTLISKFTDIREVQPQAALQQIINTLGKASAQSQSIKQPITTFEKVFFSPDRMYIAVEHPNIVIGFLRVGPKTLFYFHPKGQTIKIEDCLCVLDFYVWQQHQRKGYGKKLFECFLNTEGVQPHKIAYDRPSLKMLRFLKKNYGLKDYVSQNNNFVIFNNYFSNQPGVPAPTKSQQQRLYESRRPSQIHQEEERLYRSAERDLMNKNSSISSIVDFQSNQNGLSRQYQNELKNSMASSAKTNMIFKSIQKLSEDKSNPISFGYTRPNLGKRVNPASFKIYKNQEAIEQAQERMHNAEDQLDRIKQQIQELQSNVKKSVGMPSYKTSSDYGKYIRRKW